MPNDSAAADNVAHQAKHSTWPGLFGLILLGLLLGFSFQGTRGLWSPDEGRYVDAALEMIDSGNYIAPAYSPDEVNFSKPPTTYWILAASFKVFGRTTWAARIPYAIAFVLTLLTLYGVGRVLLPDRPWLPGLIYGCAAFPLLASNVVSTDAFLTLCEGVAMWGFISAAFAADARILKRYVLLFWLGLGAAFLTKGPPGLLPLLAIIPFLVQRDGWRGLKPYFTLPGILLFLLIGLSWYAVAVVRYAGLLHYFLHQELYQRIFTSVQHRNPGLFGWAVAYLPTLVLGALPWWPLLMRHSSAWASSAMDSALPSSRGLVRFLTMWFSIPFVVFCLAQSRLPLYLLPLFLPLSLLGAWALRDRLNLRSPPQAAMLALWLLGLIGVKAGTAYFIHSAKDNRLMARQLDAIANPRAYETIIFVQETGVDYAVEEDVPWGLRLYMGKPVYGIPWLASKGESALCHALRASSTSLLVIEPNLKPNDINAVIGRCVDGTIINHGSWRGRRLELVQP
ncbi:MAG TPA: glycosyltransferase family 39 protein [Dyella sp.]|uniref:ArnT family glycosyltransferase n=1 Tax=Dyella sp. TaxID=1869338 RepID=UPI002CF6E28B|nr:glycosyltransferase family 39 protein [Dyella sp.]HTV86155.1 glycosyltransferase family 39 protein [Dyella sp.]